MTTLILVRHGQSRSNLDKTFAGQSDVKLTELGHRQAEMAAKFLKDRHFDAAYSSTLSRALETAAPIVKDRNLEIVQVHDLCETALGDWEGLEIDSVREEYAVWKSDMNYAPPGGESTYTVCQRFGKAIDKIASDNDGKTVLVATHGGCIRTLPSYLANDPELLHTTPIASNVSITTVVYENGVGNIVEYAFDAYLGEMITQFDNGN